MATAGTQVQPAASVHESGSFLITWSHYTVLGEDDISGQLFDAVGVRFGQEWRINNLTAGAQWASANSFAADRMTVVWHSDQLDGSGLGIAGVNFQTPSGIITGTQTGQPQKKHAPLPTEFKLHQNYPNPFNLTTTIPFDLPVQSKVKIVIYNILGEHVRRLVSEIQPAGYHQVIWDGKDDNGQLVSSGVYIYRITATETRRMGTIIRSRKMVVMK